MVNVADGVLGLWGNCLYVRSIRFLVAPRPSQNKISLKHNSHEPASRDVFCLMYFAYLRPYQFSTLKIEYQRKQVRTGKYNPQSRR